MGFYKVFSCGCREGPMERRARLKGADGVLVSYHLNKDFLHATFETSP